MYYFLGLIVLFYVFATLIPHDILSRLHLPPTPEAKMQNHKKDRIGRAAAVAMAASGYPGAALMTMNSPDAADYAALMGIAENGGSTTDRLILADDLEDMLIQEAVIQYLNPAIPKW